MTMTTEEAVTALSASCLPCELAAAREEMPLEELSDDTQKWEGILTHEGQATGDGRVIQPNALRWDTLPIPLRWVQADSGGHDNAVVVGRINEIERREDGSIYGYGDFDLGSEAGREAARQVERGLTSGVSVDLDDVSFEVRVASEASEYMNEDVELAVEEPDENGRVKVASQKPDDEMMITTDARLRAATLLAIPAFESARIALAAAGWDESRHPRVPSGVPDIGGQFIDSPLDILEKLDGIRLNNGVRDDELEGLRQQIRAAMEAGEPGDLEVNEKLYHVADELDALAEETDDDDYAHPDFHTDVADAAEGIRTFASVEDWEDDEDTSLNEELDEEERAAADAEDADIKSVGDFLPEAIKQIDDANPTPSEDPLSEVQAIADNEESPHFKNAVADAKQKLADGDPDAAVEILKKQKANLSDTDRRYVDPEVEAIHDERDAAIDAAIEAIEDEFGFTASAAEYEFNWVEDTGTGHLPQYIKRIAKHLEKKGMTEGHAIATAVNAVKKMCATGDINFPGKQQVNVGSQAEACAAVAEWEEKKAQAKADAAETDEFKAGTKIAPRRKRKKEEDEKAPARSGHDESKHPRAPSGSDKGGEFVPKDGGNKPLLLDDIPKSKGGGGGGGKSDAEKAKDKKEREDKAEKRKDEQEDKADEKAEDSRGGIDEIDDESDLQKAIESVDEADEVGTAKAYIKKRARALDREDLIPEEWSVMTAAAFPMQPPSAWFADPELDGPTPLKVTPDGRVYGHLAVWGTCHTAFPGQCVTPPYSPSNYSYFRTGSVYTAEGTEQNTGVITMDTMHAGKNLSAVSTLAHYEHTGRAIADVNAGEDAYGIWVAGSLRPGATDEQVRALRGAPLSGDWRKIGSSGLELVAALAVNVPGFPIPRPQGLAAGGSMHALVAAGMLAPTPPTRKARRTQRKSLSEDDYAYLKRLADRERALVEAETAQMAREVLASDLASSIGL